eukprot:53792-Hanusia_phi.AAC.1
MTIGEVGVTLTPTRYRSYQDLFRRCVGGVVEISHGGVILQLNGWVVTEGVKSGNEVDTA